MRAIRSLYLAGATALLVAAPAMAQDGQSSAAASKGTAAAEPPAEHAAIVTRQVDGTRVHFEAPKQDLGLTGVRLELGGSFTLTGQALDHSNTAQAKIGADGLDANRLGSIRPGVNLPTANLNLGVQLAKGIRVDLESYMSSRHHNEFWVKGGYATIDASPIDLPVLNKVMEHLTIRAGMYEPNYGDAHFRRTDNGNTINNPFAENYILDAFTTEPGMDALVRMGDFFVMGGLTTGENNGDTKEGAVKAKPAFVGKIGYDRRFSEDLRVRLSGSAYNVSSSPSATLYWGDRTGGPYWGVLDNAAGANHWNGRLNPGFRNEVAAFQVNPFVQLGNLELFGVLEKASGKAASETRSRDISQYAGDAVYRLLNDKLYIGGRYNVASGDFDGQTDLTIDRKAIAAGWFLTPNLLTKLEYVTQNFDGFAATDIHNGGEFSGFVLQGAISF